MFCRVSGTSFRDAPDAARRLLPLHAESGHRIDCDGPSSNPSLDCETVARKTPASTSAALALFA
jgi:hypothetical protein